jgi:uncharacterized protein (DUF849 family)
MRERIMVSCTGARLSKADHPGLPLSSAEIAAEAAACFAAGAGALHLHVRDGAGRHSLDAGRYREVMAEVASAAPDMAVQITTESGGVYGVEDQAACLRALKPGWASVALREMARDVQRARRLYHDAEAQGTALQHILYEPGDIARLGAWQDQGIVPPGRLSAIFVLGRYGEQAARCGDLDGFLAQPEAGRLDWMACAFGAQERAVLVAALDRGGRVRVGFENNIHQPDGKLLETNAQSVRLFLGAFTASSMIQG